MEFSLHTEENNKLLALSVSQSLAITYIPMDSFREKTGQSFKGIKFVWGFVSSRDQVEESQESLQCEFSCHLFCWPGLPKRMSYTANMHAHTHSLEPTTQLSVLLAQVTLRRDARQLEEVGTVATANGNWVYCRVWGQTQGVRELELLLWRRVRIAGTSLQGGFWLVLV